MLKLSGLALAAAGIVVLATACAASGEGGRQVAITQGSDGCTPGSVSVTPGEKLQLVVKNEAKSDYEVEGIDGTKLEEVVVPEGRTRKVGYTVPSGSGTYKVKCYVPAGVSTIIELVAGAGAAAQTTPVTATPSATPESGTLAALKKPDVTIAVTLADYTVTPDKPSVKAGVIRFIATNVSTDQAHELAVMRVKDDGSMEKVDELEGMAPGQGGALTVELTPGKYQLACLITKGESGSTTDHYQQGMHTDFTVE